MESCSKLPSLMLLKHTGIEGNERMSNDVKVQPQTQQPNLLHFRASIGLLYFLIPT